MKRNKRLGGKNSGWEAQVDTIVEFTEKGRECCGMVVWVGAVCRRRRKGQKDV